VGGRKGPSAGVGPRQGKASGRAGEMKGEGGRERRPRVGGGVRLGREGAG
jgi:hypothetical protein